jgi:hypothetical protein
MCLLMFLIFCTNGYKLIEIFSDDAKKINVDILIDEIMKNKN